MADSRGGPVPLTVVGSRTEAQLIVGLLADSGVNAFVGTDDAGGQEPQLQLRGVRVRVAPSDLAPARRLLAAAVRPDGADGGEGSPGLPVQGRLPSFDGATGWLNSPPLSPGELRGRVVLVDFW